MEKERSCIIIGAGLAGLAAGYALVKKGWKVHILEARERIGGRVLSYQFDQTQTVVCELGAEWIGDKHLEMLKLCRELHLETQPHRYTLSFWDGVETMGPYQPSESPFSKAAQTAFEKVEKEYDALERGRDLEAKKEFDRQNWWNTLASKGFPENELRIRDLMDSTDFGETIRLSSAYNAAAEYCGDAVSRTDAMDRKIIGGNSLLPNGLAAKINSSGLGTIEIGSPVLKIVQRKDHVSVHVGGAVRRHFVADFCICTAPASCLNDMKWNPEPKNMLQAARLLQYARIVKTAVLYGHRFWPAYRKGGFSVFSGRASDFTFDSTYLQKGPYGILCSYAIGDKADDLSSELSHYNLMEWISEDAARSLGKDPKSAVALAVKQQAWQREKESHGAYAFYQPGQWFELQPLLSPPFGRVHFAGEHLSDEWQGFMEGAVETGQNAASAVLKGKIGAI
jgi:monoamine oxidase